MKRLVAIIFGIVGVVLVLVLFLGKRNTQAFWPQGRETMVIPQVQDQHQPDAPNHNEEEGSDLISLIPLYPDELLVGTLGIDFDGDGYDDQINSIRKTTDPNIQLLVGLYNPYKGQYDRSAVIPTGIQQAQTFSYVSMDVLGDHRNALVYSGILEDGDAVMQIHLPKKEGSKLTMHKVGDFKADGTIFIQQMDRHESYQSQRSKGVSFPVWVHTTDTARGNRMDQLQIKYVWSGETGEYVKESETRVAQTKDTSLELAKILDGTEQTFKGHLDGLWYNVNSPADDRKYLFFNSHGNEIIFEGADAQEVYTWIDSTLRRNGIYITSINSSINNLTRRIDVSLSGTEEIRVRSQDDVLMTISERSLWDGQYKKMPVTAYPQQNVQKEQSIIEILETQKNWRVSGMTEITFQQGGYQSSLISGATTSSIFHDHEILQIRGAVGAPFYNQDAYIATTEYEGAQVLAVNLVPVKITPLGIEHLNATPVKLEADFGDTEDTGELASLPSIPEEPLVPEPNKPPVLSVRTTPDYFSPDNDGVADMLSIMLGAASEKELRGWSFKVYDPSNGREFWSRSGEGMVASQITWDGHGNNGELVQAATDYPYAFFVEDESGAQAKKEGIISIDVLVIRTGTGLKIQVPSIIFRSNHADFVGKAEDPERGLDKDTIDNNIRVIQRIAQILNKFRDYKVRIEGHANNLSGTEAEETSTENGNIPLVPLSEARAETVRKMLVQFGVNASRLSAVGMGGRQPVVPRSDNANWWKNRRVEFILEK